jgi:ABC-type transport system involved in multi-copper enzyme maturation permease subunit
MKAFIVSAVLSGLRSRSIQTLFGLALLALACAWLAANFSARNPTTLALDVGLSALRFITIIMVLFWVQDLFAKDIERKSVLFILAYPVPRSSFVLGQYLGIAVLAALAVLIVGSLLWLLIRVGPSEYQQATPVSLGAAYWTTLFFQYLGVMVIAAFAVLIATLSTTPMLPLVLGLAFALAATALGPTYDYLQTSVYADESQRTQLSPVIGYLMWGLPDLSRLDIRVWPLYDKVPAPATLVAGLATALGYIALSLGLAVNRFQRREFS